MISSSKNINNNSMDCKLLFPEMKSTFSDFHKLTIENAEKELDCCLMANKHISPDEDTDQARKIRKISLTDSDLYPEIWSTVVKRSSETPQNLFHDRSYVPPPTPTKASIDSSSSFLPSEEMKAEFSPLVPIALWKDDDVPRQQLVQDNTSTFHPVRARIKEGLRSKPHPKGTFLSTKTSYFDNCKKNQLLLKEWLFMPNYTYPGVPAILKDYTTYGELGMGKFSEVYQIIRKESSTVLPAQPGVYALKKSKKSLKSEKDVTAAIEEMKITHCLASHLPTEYGLQCYGGWKEDGFVYTLLEFVPHGSVADFLVHAYTMRATLSINMLCQMFADIVFGLQALHQLGYVHADMKPSNWLITSDHHIKICDFGLVSKIGQISKEPIGDARYMAKEMLNDTIFLPSLDIFSVGISFYEMLCISMQIRMLDHFASEEQIIQTTQAFAASPMFVLPDNGPIWHDLRDQQPDVSLYQRVPSVSTTDFVHTNFFITLLWQMMHPQPQQRISLSDILQSPEIQSFLPPPSLSSAASSASTTTGAPSISQCRVVLPVSQLMAKPCLNRSNSYDAIFQ